MESFGPFLIIIIIFSIFFYFIPTFIAFSRSHDSKGWVFFLNILLGWTGLGWLFCLLWAAFGKTHSSQIVTQQGTNTRIDKWA